MAILDRSPELVVAQRRRRQGKRHSQDSRPAPFSQYAGMGISLGTAAGVLLVLFCSPNGNCAAAVDRASSHRTGGVQTAATSPSNSAAAAIPAVPQVTQSIDTTAQQAVQTVPVLPAAEKTPWDAGDPAASSSTTNASESNRSAEEKSAPSARPAMDESKPDAQHQEIKPVPAEKPHARPAHPVKRTPRFALASLGDVKASEILKVI